jgi:GH24 family phage-related lysozyme (muramidase)
MSDEDSAGGAARAAAAPLAQLRRILVVEEGRRTRVYRDSRGFDTVGIGHLVRPQDGLKAGEVISAARVDRLFAEDAGRALAAARAQAAEAGVCDPGFLVRLAAVNFQLGSGWTKRFPRTWGLILAGDYEEAATGLGKSLWARQTPRRVAAFQAALRRLADAADRKSSHFVLDERARI